jgi:DNA-directed RNA polymerase specialized sigma24 family protein
MLAMKYKEAMSVREIALILQKTENAVKLQLSRARKKLRAELR